MAVGDAPAVPFRFFLSRPCCWACVAGADEADGEDGDAAREVLPSAIAKSEERLCTVGRTVQLGASVTSQIV